MERAERGTGPALFLSAEAGNRSGTKQRIAAWSGFDASVKVVRSLKRILRSSPNDGQGLSNGVERFCSCGYLGRSRFSFHFSYNRPGRQRQNEKVWAKVVAQLLRSTTPTLHAINSA